MHQTSTILSFDTPGQGIREITGEVSAWVAQSGMRQGLLTLLCRHTSASLLIQENAAGAVRHDLMHWLERLAPEDERYLHDSEGPDDMPAHLRSALTGVTLSIPVIDGRMALGTWQGLFLIEHRHAPHRRTIAANLIGD